jgi:hypothetical protein
MSTLSSLLASASATLEELAASLDALGAGARITAVRELSAEEMVRLYQLAAGAPRLTVDDLVAGLAEGSSAVFMGKNSLPAHTTMEKRFTRHGGEVVGYNVQSLSFATGPGYFTCVDGGAERAKEVLLDYTRVPASAPPGWPAPRSNARGISLFVFNKLNDYLRRVSRDVVIGETTKDGKVYPLHLGRHFAMARV